MKFDFIEQHQVEFSVRRMCGVLVVSPSGFYAWKKRPESQTSQEDRRLIPKIRSIFAESRESYGSPRIRRALRRAGEHHSRKRIARLMRQEGLRPKKARRYRQTTVAEEGHPKAPNILDRQFNPDRPNAVWAGDITYLWTPEGWLYLAVLLDLFSRKVVGWAVSNRMTRDLVLVALRRALSERNVDAGLILHSDRGSQYTSDDYRQAADDNQLIVSMSRKGNCWDNAVVESFFATLKTELGSQFVSRQQGTLKLIDYIEVFYNRQRLHSSNNYWSPAEVEAQYIMAVA